MNDEQMVTSAIGLSRPRTDLQAFNVTTGTSNSSAFYFAPRITEQAREIIPRLNDPRMAEAAGEVLSAIEEAAFVFAAAGGDVAVLSPVRARLPEDGSVAIEWIQREFRLGFNIEKNPDDSGWYLVTSSQLGETGGYGVLSARNARAVATLAFQFVRENS